MQKQTSRLGQLLRGIAWAFVVVGILMLAGGIMDYVARGEFHLENLVPLLIISIGAATLYFLPGKI